MPYTILQIDAWGNNEDGYEWNSWVKIGTTDIIPKSSEQFIKEVLKGEAHHINYDIQDDGHNIVLVQKEDLRPLFAVEISED